MNLVLAGGKAAASGVGSHGTLKIRGMNSSKTWSTLVCFCICYDAALEGRRKKTIACSGRKENEDRENEDEEERDRK